MGQTIRVSLPGYDALTDSTPDHYALYADQDWVLIKEFVRGTTSIANSATGTITHNLGYIPMVFVYVSDGASWDLVTGVLNRPYSTYAIDTTTLRITNVTGSTQTFLYYIFYDQIL